MTITGTELTGATAVDFGRNPATVTADTATSITATSPVGHRHGQRHRHHDRAAPPRPSAADLFTYVPAPTVTGVVPTSGPTVGGTSVTITGTNLGGAMGVDFGAAVAVITSDTVHLDHRHLPGG